MRYQITVLFNHHKMTIEQISGLTPAQIDKIAFAPRDKYGELTRPARDFGFRGLEDELAFFRGIKGWDESRPDCQRTIKRLHRKYGAKWQQN